VRASRIAKSSTEETEKGFPLAPSQKDLNPWYSERSNKQTRELEDEDEATQERR